MADTVSTGDLLTLEALITEHSDGIGRHYRGAQVEQIRAIVGYYRDIATNHLAGVKAFRDQVIIYLRAMALSAQSIGNAATHAEKAARLRGMLEILEVTVLKLEKERFEFCYEWYRQSDIFRADYTTREYMVRIHELEDEIKRLKEAAGEPIPDILSNKYTPAGTF